jgi:hypothetical protein
MSTISKTLQGLSLGQPTTFLNLTLFPLSGGNGFERDYLTLREAVQAKTASVREVSAGGSVPELLMENTGKKPVLILDGEELIGAKQNRTANVTILAPAGKTIRIPVTCVEAGRWSDSGSNFEPSDQMHFYEGRKTKMASVHESMQNRGSRAANQGQVWADIDDKCESLAVEAPTQAMADVYAAHSTRVDDYVGAFGAGSEQVGAVFAIGNKIEGLELFDCQDTLADMLPKLIRSYAIDAIESVEAHRRNPVSKDAETFIEELMRAKVDTSRAIGLGKEVRLTADRAIAGGLLCDKRVVHLAAFSTPTQTNQNAPEQGGMFARFKARRRTMGG